MLRETLAQMFTIRNELNIRYNLIIQILFGSFREHSINTEPFTTEVCKNERKNRIKCLFDIYTYINNREFMYL